MPPFWDPDLDRPIVVGHRGVRRSGVLENTRQAFARAVEEGADAVELDVRRSGDGIAVVHHDPYTRAGSAIIDAPVDRLLTDGIETLEAVLAALAPSVGVDIEVKNLPHEPDYDETDALVDLVAEAVRNDAQRRLLVTSFSPFTVAALAQALPDVERGLVTMASVDLNTAVELAGEYGASVICPQLGAAGLDADGVARAHAAGIRVMAWELGAVDALINLAGIGVDALCVDDPGRVRGAVDPLFVPSGDDGQGARHAAQLD